MASSITQPLFGRLSDRRSHRLLLPGAIAPLHRSGLAACALAPNYLFALAAIFLSGLGVAAYHPEASRLASVLAGDQRGTGHVAVLGRRQPRLRRRRRARGVSSPTFGLDGGWLLVIPGMIGASLIYLRLPRTRPLRLAPPAP